MDKILLFAGTTEGRHLAEYLDRQQVETHVCVATEYGEKLLLAGNYLHIHTGRLTEEEMREVMKNQGITITVDATHPYAAVVSENIRQACLGTGCEYIRLLRSASEGTKECVCVDSLLAAVEFLKGTTGNILTTTGSKELGCFRELPDYKERVFARVLSTPEAVSSCAELGFIGKHLICMQGPFSEELNTAMLRQVQAKWMVTKESGKSGGFEEKMRGAQKAGANVVLIGRPKEAVSGKTEWEVRSLLCRRLNLNPSPVISLVGIGMGNPENMTIEAAKVCQEAEVLIGAERMQEAVPPEGKVRFCAYKAEEIRDYVKAHPEYEKIAVLLSGDVGFYSGAKKLLEVFPEEKVNIYSGISSLVYLCGKLGIAWEDVYLTSLHGREQNIVGPVKCHRKVFALTGKGGVETLCEKLLYYGMDQVKISVGENLSYPEERITTGTPQELSRMKFDSLCVVLIENPAAENRITQGMGDNLFLRGNIPMTKEEIRSVSIGKLRLLEDSTIYDVGAGTGSVSVEMAILARRGRVYAIEKKPEAVELIYSNRKRFAADNLEVIQGLAPEALESLPTPTHAFIGGSSGNLMEILQVILRKNPRARVVINAIALETVAEALRCVKSLRVTDVDMVTVGAAKAKEVGNYHMMMGQNPVYIISFTGGAR